MRRIRWSGLRIGAWLAALAAAMAGLALAQDPAPRPVVVTDVAGVIGPATAHHIGRAIAHAEARSAEALVIRLNTPGGLVTSMREIIADILASRVPVAVHVAPSGGHAASAGTFILYAAHVAAMAPGTNIGAATPVQMGGVPGMPDPGPDPGAEEEPGQEPQDTPAAPGTDPRSEPSRPAAPADPMTSKAVNDAVAYIRSLAELRDRNADWAERAVREAASLSADTALAEGVIEIVAADTPALLAAMDGLVVEIGGAERTLATEDAPVERFEPGLVTRILTVLANPNVAFILMMLGIYGLIFELANPGIGPGIPGVICLVLGLYSLNQLPLDYAGLALVGLGVAFMVAEAVTPSFGILGLGGLIAFSIGATMLVDTEVPEYQLSWGLIATVTILSALVLVVLLGIVWRAHRRRPVSGRSEMIGAPAEVVDWQDGHGHVWAHGERWEASGPHGLSPGAHVEIASIDGLTLTVGPAAQPTLAKEPRNEH